jgi:hypothetical protein
MPCSEDHATCPEPVEWVPILDELRQREEEADARAALRKRRGGPRPGSGPPKGNLNALKHGRFSRRHKIILEAILEVPSAREALVGIMKRNRQRQKQAELEAAYLLMRWLATHNPQFLPQALGQVRPEWEVESRGGHERAAANLGNYPPSPAHGIGAGGEGSREMRDPQNDQTQNDPLAAALADMDYNLKRKLLRKTTKKRTPKPKDRPNDART